MFSNLLFEDAAAPGMSVTSIILIAVLIVAFVGLIWFSNHSQKKKQKQAVEMNMSLKPGDKIKTIGGIVGTIVAVDEESGNFEIQTGSTTMILDRNAVYPVSYFDAQNAKSAKTDTSAKAEEVSVEEAEAEAPAEDKTDSDKQE